LDRSGLLEGGSVGIDRGWVRLEVLDDGLGGDERPEAGAERGVEGVADAPVVVRGGAKQAEARHAGAIAIERLEVELGE
jgi:hypothetical protein